MYPLTVSEADILVRKNLDEQEENYSNILGDTDSSELSSLLRKTIAEAINAVHMAAPVQVLDGKTLSGDEIENVSINERVISFATRQEILRLVAFRAADSSQVVTELTPEDSQEGRMQTNPYTRGTSGRPRLVLRQGKTEAYLSSFKYYTVSGVYSTPASAIERFEYIPLYRYEEDVETYDVAENVVGNVIDQLTGMMLAVYGENDKAQYFFSKAAFA